MYTHLKKLLGEIEHLGTVTDIMMYNDYLAITAEGFCGEEISVTMSIKEGEKHDAVRADDDF